MSSCVSTLTPLHPAQEEVFYDQLMDIESPHFNVGGYTILRGHLDKEKLKTAIKSATEVFDVFRLKIILTNEKPYCEFLSHVFDTRIDELDFSSDKNPCESALQWMQERFRKTFHLGEDLLYEQALLKIGGNEYWWYGRFHHLILDGYGFAIYTKYVADKYTFLVRGMLENSRFIYPQYSKEVFKATGYPGSESYESDKLYWMHQFREVPRPLLKKRYCVDHLLERKSGTIVLDITDSQRKLLRDLSTKTNNSLQQLTLAAVAIYFGRTENRSDIVFGIPIHNRRNGRERSIAGMFSSMIPFKCEFSANRKVEEFLSEVRTRQRHDYRHQSYPISHLNKNLDLMTEGRNQIFDIVVNYALLDFDLKFEAIQTATYNLFSENEKLPLNFCWCDYGEQQPLQLCVNFQYAYFTKKEAELLAHRILFILEQFRTCLEKKLSEISLLPEDEYQLVNGFNKSGLNSDPDKTLVDLFEEQVSKTPDAIAVVFGNQQMTYRQLDESANQVGHYLRSRGIKEETLVPIFLGRSIEMITGILGILKAGAAYVPIDPAYPQDRIAYMLKDCDADLVLTNSSCQHLLPDDIIKLEIDKPHDQIDKAETAAVQRTLTSHNLAYVIYTSGSTGNPKGVMIEHRSLVNYITNSRRLYVNDAGNSSGSFIHLSNTFDASLTALFVPLVCGKSIIIGRGKATDVLKDPALKKYAPYDFIKLTPSHLRLLKGVIGSDKNEFLTHRLVVGGEALQFEHFQYLIDRGIHMEIINEYGPTEATVGCSIYSVNTAEPRSTGNKRVSIGKPIDNAQIYIVDGENNLMPVGVAGELCIGGVQVARGYLHLEKLTSEKFIKNPFSNEPGARLYKTGDMARWLPDGNIEFIGRKDEQVKIRGYRIELPEIERILQQSEEVSQCMVVAKEDAHGHSRLAAYIVPSGIFNKESVRAYLKSRLPEYMVPSLLVELRELPLTHNGKVDKKASNMDAAA